MKQMMYDFRVFNTEICDVPSDTNIQKCGAKSDLEVSEEENESPVKKGYAPKTVSTISIEKRGRRRRRKKRKYTKVKEPVAVGKKRDGKQHVKDQVLCHIIQKVICDEITFNYDDVVYSLNA